MRILLTGAAGFTGRYFTELALAKGHEVFSLKANLRDATAVMDEVALVKPEAVLHLAAISFVGHEPVEEIYEVNLIGTRHLLHALSEKAPNMRHVLLASSATVYGNQAQGLIAESAPLLPANDYAVSKVAMEHLATLWAGRLPISIVRPFNYVGVGQSSRFVIPKIVSHFAKKAPLIELGNIEVWREYNDVRWVAAVYLHLLSQGAIRGPVNLASGRLVSLGEVLSVCRALTGQDMQVAVNPDFIRANEVTRLGGDPARLNGFGVPASNYTLEDTLRWMLTCA